MKCFIAPILICSLCAFLQAHQIQKGDPVTAVLDALGQPEGIIEVNGVEAYSYPQGVIRIQNGIVMSVSDDFYSESGIYEVEADSLETNSKPPPNSLQLTLGANEPEEVVAAVPEFRWFQNYGEARVLAQQTQRPLLLFFTGSDWCGWCHRLQDEVLKTSQFKDFAKDKLILVEVDFPNGFRLPRNISEQNEKLKNTWSVRGFPTIVLLDAQENYLTRGGYARGGAQPFIEWLASNIPGSPNYQGPQSQSQGLALFGISLTSPAGLLKIALIGIGILILLNKVFRR